MLYESSIWLTEISRTLPSSAILVGTDVSLEQCPPKAWLASNVSFQTWSIFDEPPGNFIGRFDLVHLRFLSFVIKDNELTSTLMRVMKTLSKSFLTGYYSTYLLQCPWRFITLTHSSRERRLDSVGRVRSSKQYNCQSRLQSIIIELRDPAGPAASGYHTSEVRRLFYALSQ